MKADVWGEMPVDTIILTSDAYLKVLDTSDTMAMYESTVRNRHHLKQWLPWVDSIKGPQDTESFIISTMDLHAVNQGIHYGIWYKRQFAGTLGNHGINWANRRTTIGYWLAEGFQGKGLMTEAVAAYIDQLVFGVWQLNRVEIAAATGNAKSRAIPERLGFTFEGVIRQNEWLYDHYVDHAIYGLLSAEWKA